MDTAKTEHQGKDRTTSSRHSKKSETEKRGNASGKSIKLDSLRDNLSYGKGFSTAARGRGKATRTDGTRGNCSGLVNQGHDCWP